MFYKLWRIIRWTPETTGTAIIAYNYLPLKNQNQMKGIYFATRNAMNTCSFAARLIVKYRYLKLSSIAQSDPEYKQNLQQFHQYTAENIASLCTQNKGVYSRLCQKLGSISTLIPEIYRRVFKVFKDQKGIEVPYEEVKAQLQTSFNKPMKQLFDQFQKVPLYVGLMSQVHRGVLFDNYHKVIVKIKPAHIDTQSVWDIWYINQFTKLILLVLPDKHKDNIQFYCKMLADLEKQVIDEIDFEREKSNADKYRELTANSPVYVPYYYKKYCNKLVIFKEFIEGVAITDKDSLAKLGVTAQIVFDQLIKIILRVSSQANILNSSVSQQSVLIRRLQSTAPEANNTIPNIFRINFLRNTRSATEQLANIQIVLLDHKNYENPNNQLGEGLMNFWTVLKEDYSEKPKGKIQKIILTATDFYNRFEEFSKAQFMKSQKKKRKQPQKQSEQQTRTNILTEKLYRYQPLLNLYNRVMEAQ